MSTSVGATATSWNERLVTNPYIKTVPKLEVSVDVLALLYWRRLVSCDLVKFTRHDLWVEWQPIRGRKLDLKESAVEDMPILPNKYSALTAQAVLTVNQSQFNLNLILGYPYTNVDIVNVVDYFSEIPTQLAQAEKVLKLSKEIANAEHTKYTRRAY